MLNSRDITKLRSDVHANCKAFLRLCEAEGLKVLVTQTVRDEAYQASLYAQGRTKPGKKVTNVKIPTFHSDKAGLAFDICQNIKGTEYSDTEFFRRCGEIGKKCGFSWGGDWKSFIDMPHFQWDYHGRYTGSMIRAGNLPPLMPRCKVEETPVNDYAAHVQRRYMLASETMAYLRSYKYAKSLFERLATTTASGHGATNEAKVKERFRFADETMAFLKNYKYSADLLKRFAEG